MYSFLALNIHGDYRGRYPVLGFQPHLVPVVSEEYFQHTRYCTRATPLRCYIKYQALHYLLIHLHPVPFLLGAYQLAFRKILNLVPAVLKPIEWSAMNFGFGIGDFVTVLNLAAKVYAAYHDAPGDYKNISEEVKSLQIIVQEGVQHFQSTTFNKTQQQEGAKVLQGCQSVLADLDFLIEKYKGLTSASRWQVFSRVKLGKKDITTLRARLDRKSVV